MLFSTWLLLIVAKALDGTGKLGTYVPAEKSLVEPGLFDRIVRLVGGRRNTYVWVLAGCVVLAMPEKALIVMAYWEVATAAVDLLLDTLCSPTPELPLSAVRLTLAAETFGCALIIARAACY